MYLIGNGSEPANSAHTTGREAHAPGSSSVLSREIDDWSAKMWEIERIGKPAQPRLIASEKITASEFDEIASALEEFGVTPYPARKVGFIAVRVAEKPEPVHTKYYGQETKNEAMPGDWIAVNMDRDFQTKGISDADAHLVKDDHGNMDRYVIKRLEMKTNYRSTGKTTSQGGVYEAINPEANADVLHLRAGFDILAPWGERQIRQSGVLIRKNGEVYGIYDRAFDKTYERVDNG